MDAALAIIENTLSADRIIEGIVDAKTARTAAISMDKLKKMLDLADEYGNYASEYCTKEAELYIRIASVDGADSMLPDAKRKLVNWIRSKTKSQISDVLAECKRGTRISTIMNREYRDEKKIEAELAEVAEYKRISKAVITEFDSTGRTSITPMRYFDSWKLKSEPDSAAAKAFTEKTRDELLRRGGIGLADGDGTYINPLSSNRYEVAEAVEARLRSIHCDILSLISICEKTRFAIPDTGIDMLIDLLDKLRSSND